MKNQAVTETTSQHTQGDLTTTNYSFIHERRHYFCEIKIGKRVIAEAYGKTTQEAEANAQRIVRAMNVLSNMEKNVQDLDYTKRGRSYDYKNDVKCHYLKQLLKGEINK